MITQRPSGQPKTSGRCSVSQSANTPASTARRCDASARSRRPAREAFDLPVRLSQLVDGQFLFGVHSKRSSVAQRMTACTYGRPELVPEVRRDRSQRLVPDVRAVGHVATSGPVPIPHRLPDVVARIGIDLDPVDLRDEVSRSWLESLVWPEHRHRLERLRAAMSVVLPDPPSMLRGDLVDRTPDALALVPSGVTPVVFHSAVLNYIPPARRVGFANQLDGYPDVVWISNEGSGNRCRVDDRSAATG